MNSAMPSLETQERWRTSFVPSSARGRGTARPERSARRRNAAKSSSGTGEVSMDSSTGRANLKAEAVEAMTQGVSSPVSRT